MFTVTSKDTLAVPAPSAVAAGTLILFHVILPLLYTPPSLIFSSLYNVVPVGTLSSTSTYPSTSVVFVNVIVYLNLVPGSTIAFGANADVVTVPFICYS